MTANAEEPEPAVRIRNMAGELLAEVSPVPETVGALKRALEERLGCPAALQKVVKLGQASVFGGLYGDDAVLDAAGVEVAMIVDESAMYMWDYDGNPQRTQLVVEGSVVKCPELRTDYINVLTREPIRKGVHYFEFHMHCIGDEQWCGVVRDPSVAGSRLGGRSLEAWAYYVGRMGSASASITDGHGALHANHRAVAKFETLQRGGDVIGMLVDMDGAAIAFDLNGKLQGACSIRTDGPVWVLTHMDTSSDHVELRKRSLQDAPPESLAALRGTMIEVSKGKRLRKYFNLFGDTDDSDSSSDSDSSLDQDTSESATASDARVPDAATDDDDPIFDPFSSPSD